MGKEPHVHKFTKIAVKRIPLTAGRKVAVDFIKQFKCECGKTQAFDLERNVKP